MSEISFIAKVMNDLGHINEKIKRAKPFYKFRYWQLQIESLLTINLQFLKKDKDKLKQV